MVRVYTKVNDTSDSFGFGLFFCVDFRNFLNSLKNLNKAIPPPVQTIEKKTTVMKRGTLFSDEVSHL